MVKMNYSPPFNYFSKLNQDYAKCRKCGSVIKSKGFASKLIRHLKMVHKMHGTFDGGKIAVANKIKANKKKQQIIDVSAKARLRTCSRLTCSFCKSAVDDEVSFGAMYTIGHRQTCHHFCLLLSKYLPQNGRDDQGILGFMPVDITREVKRSYAHVCVYCFQHGANLTCDNSECEMRFHLPCGRKHGTMSLFHTNFQSYCIFHRPNQKIPLHIFESRIGEPPGSLMINLKPVDYQAQVASNKIVTVATKRNFSSEEYTCGICSENIIPMPSSEVFWPPCCQRDRWFHRICVEKLALSAGKHFLKCPLCNDQPIFVDALLKYGFYIPDQDASWEREAGAFSELLERPKTCYVEKCKCPRGRNYNSRRWKLLFCETCGSQAAHKTCIKSKSSLICSRCQPADQSPAISDTGTSEIKRGVESESISITSCLKKEKNAINSFENLDIEMENLDCKPIDCLSNSACSDSNTLTQNPSTSDKLKIFSPRKHCYIDSKHEFRDSLPDLDLVTVKKFIFLEMWQSFGRYIDNVEYSLISDFNEDRKCQINLNYLDVAGVLKNDWELSVIVDFIRLKVNSSFEMSLLDQSSVMLNYYSNCKNISTNQMTHINDPDELNRFFQRLRKNKVKTQLKHCNRKKYSDIDKLNINSNKKLRCKSDITDFTSQTCVASNLKIDSDLSLSTKDTLYDDKNPQTSLRSGNIRGVISQPSVKVVKVRMPFNEELLLCSKKENESNLNHTKRRNRRTCNGPDKSKIKDDFTSEGCSTELKINFDVLSEWKNDVEMKEANDEENNSYKYGQDKTKILPAFLMKLKLKLKGLNVGANMDNKVVDSTLTFKTDMRYQKNRQSAAKKSSKKFVKKEKSFRNYNLYKYFKVDEKKYENNDAKTLAKNEETQKFPIIDLLDSEDECIQSGSVEKKIDPKHVSVIVSSKRRRIEKENILNSGGSNCVDSGDTVGISENFKKSIKRH